MVELLETNVQQGYGDRPAIFSADGILTYAQLQAQVDKVAHVLTHDMGLVPGNRVLLRSANNAMLAICWCAVAKAGLIVVATMPLLREKELVDIIEKAANQRRHMRPAPGCRTSGGATTLPGTKTDNVFQRSILRRA